MTTPITAPSTWAPFTQLGEKVLATFIQVSLTAWLAADTFDFTGSQQWIVAAVAASATVLANGIPETIGRVHYAVDVAYRLARTYVVAFLALFGSALAVAVVAPGQTAVDLVAVAGSAAAWGALPAALAFVKSLAARYVGNSGTVATAALLPVRLDVPPSDFGDPLPQSA